MSSILKKLRVEKNEEMSGLGTDQSALKDDLQAEIAKSDSHPAMGVHTHTDEGELGHGKGAGIDRAPNTFGGPSLGRTSAVPRHENETLNKMDPRIGYDADEVRKEELEKYEAKYGKPDDISDAHMRGRDMGGKWSPGLVHMDVLIIAKGIDSDQSALGESPEFK